MVPYAERLKSVVAVAIRWSELLCIAFFYLKFIHKVAQGIGFIFHTLWKIPLW